MTPETIALIVVAAICAVLLIGAYICYSITFKRRLDGPDDPFSGLDLPGFEPFVPTIHSMIRKLQPIPYEDVYIKSHDGLKLHAKYYHKVDGVLTLPWSAYADQITKVVVEEGVDAVGQMAFYELPNLQEVVLPESLVEIRNYAFKNCAKLTTVNLENVDFIREGAFYGCSALEGIEFAEGVTIEEWAFTKTPVVLP